MGEKRSYLNPKFETDVKGKSMDQLIASASWNWDLAKRKIKRVINQRTADAEWKREHPEKKEEKGLRGTGRARKQLLDLEKEGY